MEIVSSTESESNVKAEVNRRTYKAGYTDRGGHRKTSSGKGDLCRPTNKKKYDENYDRIFGKA